MLVRISDPTLMPELVRTLEERAGYVVQQVRDDAVAVGVLGSFADGGELDLTLFLAAWRQAHPNVALDVSRD